MISSTAAAVDVVEVFVEIVRLQEFGFDGAHEWIAALAAMRTAEIVQIDGPQKCARQIVRFHKQHLYKIDFVYNISKHVFD